MRLQKFLAGCGVASRRQAEQLIASGRVRVNGQPVELGARVDPECDVVTLDSHELRSHRKVYILLNKPAGVISSVKDTHGRATVVDCLTKAAQQGIRGPRNDPPPDQRVFPVGRLDRDVEGALLLTNDGELTYRLTHPKFQIDKTYHVWVDGPVASETLVRLEKGVRLEDGPAQAVHAGILSAGRRTTQLKVVMHEGRKREVKRLCAAIGHPVRRMRRVSIAHLHVDGLRTGQWRYLTGEEVEELQALVNGVTHRVR